MSMALRAIFGLSLLFATNAWAMDTQGSHSGSWYNPDQSGHGFNIEVLNEDEMIIYWYVYNPDGTPTFLVTVAEIDGDNASGMVRTYSGMKFGEFDPLTLKEEIWGTISVQFTDCNTAQVHYNSDMSHDGVPFGSGTINLTRLTSIQGLDCRQKQSIREYGNYTVSAVSEGDFGDARVMIFRDGTMSYQSHHIFGGECGLGFGQLNMSGETTFDYELLVDACRSGDSYIFKGSGDFLDGLSLELPGGLQLQGQLDPDTVDGITLEQIAGTFWGVGGLDAMLGARLEIAQDGFVIGRTSFSCPVAGRITIPDTGINQFQFNAELGGVCSGTLWTSVGRLDGEQVHLMTRWGGETPGGIWVLTLTEE